MTNEEKAKKIADDIDNRNGRGWYDHSEIVELCYNSAMEMAKWKDEQFKQYLLQKRNGIGYRSDDIGKCSILCQLLINEIIKDLGL